MIIVAIHLAVALAADPMDAWVTTISDGIDASHPVEREYLYLPNDITPSGSVPTGRVDGRRAFIFWPNGIMTAPQLTCVDLSTRKLVWKQELVQEAKFLLFSRGKIIVANEPSTITTDGLKLRWYDIETGTPGFEFPLDPGVWFRIVDRQWLLLSNGEIRDAETGDLIATPPDRINGAGLVVGHTLTDLVFDMSAEEFQIWLRKVDLHSGKTICDYGLRERLIYEYVSLLATDELNAVLVTTKTIPQERTLVSLSLADGSTRWSTVIPPFSPIRMINSPAGLVTRQVQKTGLAFSAGLDVDWNTGITTFPVDRPSPASLFDWYIGPRSELLEIRPLNNGLVGWCTVSGAERAVMWIEPKSGRQLWSTSISSNRPGAQWLPELGNNPVYAVFPDPGELHVVEITSGRLNNIVPVDLGLPYELKLLPAASHPKAEDDFKVKETGATSSTIRRVLLALAGLAIVLLWTSRSFFSARRRT